jgi:hypothetical protein
MTTDPRRALAGAALSHLAGDGLTQRARLCLADAYATLLNDLAQDADAAPTENRRPMRGWAMWTER